MLSNVFNDTAREAPVAGEDNPRDFELVDDVTGPTMKHVDDYAIGSVLEEEQPQGFEENRGVDHGSSGHVCVGYVGAESVDGDGKTGLLVASDWFLELESDGGCG